MFTIYGGAKEFEQWETNQLVTCSCLKAGDAVVFRGHGKVYETTAFEQGGEVLADVPNFLLQKPGSIRVDVGWGLDGHIGCRTYFDVIERSKPEDYVCEYNIKNRNVSSAMGGADWNAAEGEPGHVLGRTHYEESAWAFLYTGDVVNNKTGVIKILNAGIKLSAGKKYKVVFDDSVYEQIAYVDSRGVVALGAPFVSSGVYDTSVYPFALSGPPTGASGKLTVIHYTLAEYTLEIYVEEVTVHKLDPKYLPEGIGYAETVELVNGTAVLNEDMGQLVMASDIQFTVGETYTVNYNGVDYTCTAFEIEGLGCVGNGVNLGLADTGEPFGIVATGGMLVVSDFNEATEATVRIMGEVVHRLDEKFMPLLTSPNGTKYLLTVSDNGTLTATPTA